MALPQTPNDSLSGGEVRTERIPDLIKTLHALSGKLSGFCVSSEHDFLKLGERLQDGYAQTTSLTGKVLEALKIIGSASGESVFAEAVVLINRSLEDFNECIKMVREKTRPVTEVNSSLDELAVRHEDIVLLAKYLRAVALNIFIETSRSEILNQNFSIIAGEIKQLSENIIEIAQSIHVSSGHARERFESIYIDISDGMGEMRKTTDEAEGVIHSYVSRAEKLLDTSYGAVEEAVSVAEEITGNVGTIVMGLQFHDSMRQRIEHVVSALTDCADRLKALSVPAEPGGGGLKELGSVYAILSIQVAQLTQIVGEAEQTCRQTEQAFEKIMDGITRLADRLAAVGGGSFADKTFTDLTSSLSFFHRLETRKAHVEKKLTHIHGQALDTTQKLSTQISEVREISHDAHRKALNAIIAAMHLGSEGKTLSVLAQEMKILSEQSDEFVTQVERIIGTVVSQIQEMEGGEVVADAGSRPEEGEETPLETAIGDIYDAYMKIRSESEALGEKALELNRFLAAAKGELDFFTAMAQEIRNHLGVLEEVEKGIPLCTDRTLRKEPIDPSMLERYTMEKERTIHGEEPEKAEKDGTASEEEDEFGDNIELF